MVTVPRPATGLVDRARLFALLDRGVAELLAGAGSRCARTTSSACTAAPRAGRPACGWRRCRSAATRRRSASSPSSRARSAPSPTTCWARCSTAEPPEVRELLLQTCILDQVTGPLGDVLTGRADGARGSCTTSRRPARSWSRSTSRAPGFATTTCWRTCCGSSSGARRLARWRATSTGKRERPGLPVFLDAGALIRRFRRPRRPCGAARARRLGAARGRLDESARNAPVCEPSTAGDLLGRARWRPRSPPSSPPSGPRSMMRSAVLITSRLCSITTTVLPASTRRCEHLEQPLRCRRSAGRSSARRGCRASRPWRPCAARVASLTRCASPPDSVVAGWPSRM